MNNVGMVKKERIEYISYLRVFSVICILLCHYVQEIPIGTIKSAAQIFNIGVPLFFIISGFCFGIQGEIKTAAKWYVKRIKRVYVPYEIFLLMYFSFFLILKKRIFWRDWGMYLLGMQGDYFRIPGIEQLWFITPLVICYLITPLISLVYPKLKNAEKGTKILFAGLLFLLYFAICFVPNNSIYVVASPIVFYIFAYISGREYKQKRPDKKTAVISFFVSAFALAIRIALAMLLSGTLLYERLVCTITYYIAATGIFILFEYLFFNAKGNAFIRKTDSVSFEIYLTHYAFLRGAYPYIWFTSYDSINLILAFILTVILSIAVHKINILVQKIFSERI